MKIGELASFGHNLADSLASGLCSMVGFYAVDIFSEAAASTAGEIVVDFLSGATTGSAASADLRRATLRFAEQLPELATQHGLDVAEIKVLSARFGTDRVAGVHFQVTVETTDGRSTVDQYVGLPGRRYRRPRRH